ncbi:hypothetical protein UFOVP374_41 [uncultured Caudovirales phage]|uniref:Uncharacterized protein n=1 Tax=uncultured Caudovirales phage TaxID=2100421 RepID=A0A6J7X1D5_9CAUD|nr:hypothetical protein UFOVP374_41 [uncultured Caudovirales phage]
MNLTYSVTYTQYSAAHRANFENNIWVSGARGQSLTLAGVQRILRRTHPRAIVVRRETWNRQ